MNRKKILDFITVTLFIGILLSFLLYVGIGVLFNNNSSRSEEHTSELQSR